MSKEKQEDKNTIIQLISADEVGETDNENDFSE